MRRKDREITDPGKMLAIVNACDCCRLGFVEDAGAYIVPMNFGCEAQNGTLVLYFHSAREGKKQRLMQTQKTVSFEMDTGHAFLQQDTACACGFLYQSVMGHGVLRPVGAEEEKRRALESILAHYAPGRAWTFPAAAVQNVSVFRLDVTDWSCKAHEMGRED